MALDKQTIAVPFREGVKTRSDPKQLPIGKLTTLENGHFGSPGQIQKRNGMAQLTGTVTSSQQILQGAVRTFKDELLCQNGDGNALLTFEDETNTWVTRGQVGQVVPLTVSSKSVVRTSTYQLSPDCAIHPAGLTVHAWVDLTSQRVCYRLVDTATGAMREVGFVDNNAANVTQRSTTKVGIVGNFVIIFWVEINSTGPTTKLFWRAVKATTLAWASQHTGPTFTALRGRFDIAPVLGTAPAVGEVLLLAYLSSAAADKVNVTSFSDATTDVAQGTAYASGVWATGNPDKAICLSSRAASSTVDIYFNDSNFDLVYMGWDAVTHAFTAGTIVASTKTAGAIASVANPNTSKTYLVMHSASATGDQTVLEVYESNILAFTRRSCGIAAKPFNGPDVGNATQRTYFPVQYGDVSSTQDQYMLMSSDGDVVARLGPALAKPEVSSYVKPGVATYPVSAVAEVNTVASTTLTGRSTYSFAGPTAGSLSTGGVDLISMESTPIPAPASIDMGNNLTFGGGMATNYDGITVSEQGFHVFPYPLQLSGSAGANTYGYTVVYEWTDLQGNLHQSAPAIVVSVTTTDAIGVGGATDQVVVRSPTLRLTNKEDNGTVRIAIYRTSAGGSVYNWIADVANSQTVDYVDYTDANQEATRATGRLLYTTGGVLENDAPNPFTMCVEYRDRLICNDSLDPNALQFSKQVGVGSPVEFTATFRMQIDAAGGAITGLGVLEGRLIIFKGDRIFYVTGQGPDDTGNNNDFSSDAQLIPSPVGCINHRSIVSMPNGLMFQSEQGIYLLDRSLSVGYVGADVEEFNAYDVTSALLIPNKPQVRFTLMTGTTLAARVASGRTLVYDFLVGEWSVWRSRSLPETMTAVDACIFRGVHTTLMPDEGLVLAESTGFQDYDQNADGNIELRIVTGWINVGVLQGFERLYAVMILGEEAGVVTTTVSIAYDYVATVAQTVTGTDDTGLVQRRFQPARQKCEAFQLTIYDAPDAAAEGLSLSALALVIGTKRGLNKQPAAKSLT